MEMQEIDNVIADLVEVGDYISFDGPVCAVKEINEVDDVKIQFISEDDREIKRDWDSSVSLYGYV